MSLPSLQIPKGQQGYITSENTKMLNSSLLTIGSFYQDQIKYFYEY